MSIVVVDFGTGNLRSVVKALQHVAPQREIRTSFDSETIVRSHQIVLPGQGAMGSWMSALHQYELHQVIQESLVSKPVLGICLGLQALYESSEEDGGVEGFEFLPGRVKRFVNRNNDDGIKVPHMGWNHVTQSKPHPLWHGISDNSRFYFVHSYYAESADKTSVAGETHYGVNFTAAAAYRNVFAVQFHPEKSHRVGLQLLSNFTAWDGTLH